MLAPPTQYNFPLSLVKCAVMDFGWHTQWCWETKCHLKSSAKNMQSNKWPFKSQVYCTVHWALNSGAKELTHQSHMPVIRITLNGWICLSEICFAALPNHVYLLDHPVYFSSSKWKHVARNIIGRELLKFFFQYVIQRWSEMSTLPIKVCHGISKTSQITWLTTNITQNMWPEIL